MNHALSYIEEHLTEDVDIKTAAKIACCSEYHFKRMFSSLAGMPLSEYIRRRRLTLAAQELAVGTARVVDVAIKYQYDSPDAFARAFQAHHGVVPSQARLPGQILNAYSRVTFQLAIRGGNSVKYRIVEKDAFRSLASRSGLRSFTAGKTLKSLPCGPHWTPKRSGS
jgi:AraC family transcriptional regulator